VVEDHFTHDADDGFTFGSVDFCPGGATTEAEDGWKTGFEVEETGLVEGLGVEVEGGWDGGHERVCGLLGCCLSGNCCLS